ncbi:hypothetical protein BWQ96_02352 [Gracilariopsis chorda]|uniref:Uncharacterized protein n=1 Tax=Gracilariopsis chorda TaxID=448386 RepID=A0A2V3J0M4_9FLOR|nr:hypothetical protein BWQ96_02352 [Gracilariopsis chorda]|eukprot:PXF47966.1 hypothetical protein BWQ96_02352 [Gracilariopsis chorda]
MNGRRTINPGTGKKAANVVSAAKENKEEAKIPPRENLFLSRTISDLSRNDELQSKLEFDPLAGLQALGRRQSMAQASDLGESASARIDTIKDAETIAEQGNHDVHERAETTMVRSDAIRSTNVQPKTSQEYLRDHSGFRSVPIPPTSVGVGPRTKSEIGQRACSGSKENKGRMAARAQADKQTPRASTSRHRTGGVRRNISSNRAQLPPKKPTGVSKTSKRGQKRQAAAKPPQQHNNNSDPKQTPGVGINRLAHLSVSEQVPSRAQLDILLNDEAYEKVMRFLDTDSLIAELAASVPSSTVQARSSSAVTPNAASLPVAAARNADGSDLSRVNNRGLTSCPPQPRALPAPQAVVSRPPTINGSFRRQDPESPSPNDVSALLNDEVYEGAMRFLETLQSTPGKNAGGECRTGNKSAPKTKPQSITNPATKIGGTKRGKKVPRPSVLSESESGGITKPAARRACGSRTKPPSVDRAQSLSQALAGRTGTFQGSIARNEKIASRLQSASNVQTVGLHASQPSSIVLPPHGRQSQPSQFTAPQVLQPGQRSNVGATITGCRRNPTVAHPSALSVQRNVALPVQPVLPFDTTATGRYVQSRNITATQCYPAVPHRYSLGSLDVPGPQLQHNPFPTSAGTDQYLPYAQHLPTMDCPQPLPTLTTLPESQLYNPSAVYGSAESGLQPRHAASTANYVHQTSGRDQFARTAHWEPTRNMGNTQSNPHAHLTNLQYNPHVVGNVLATPLMQTWQGHNPQGVAQVNPIARTQLETTAYPSVTPNANVSESVFPLSNVHPNGFRN